MSELAINLLKAIESGDQETTDAAFRDALNAKIADAIDAKKVEVARSMYNTFDQQDDVASDEIVTTDSDEVVDNETTETSDENGTEEV